MDLTSPVAAIQLAAGAFFLVKMAIQDLTSSVATVQLAAGRRPRWGGGSKPVCAAVGAGYHVDPAQTIENGRGGILVTHRGRGHKVR